MKKKAKEQIPEEQFSVRIATDYEDAPDRIYANHVEYSIQPYEATLAFSEVDLQRDKPTESDAEDVLESKIRSKVRIVLPLPVFESLAKIMKKYLENHPSSKDEE